MTPPSPSSPRAATAADRVVDEFMTGLARSPAPRPSAVDPRVLLRRAPLVARLARVRAGERRLLGLAIAVELATFTGAAVVLRGALRGDSFVHVHAALAAGAAHLGVHGVVSVTLIAAALLLAGWTAGGLTTASR